jgi:predicted aspartyl protease
MAPAPELKRIGIRPEGKKLYELADGSLVEYEFGLAVIEFMDTVTAGRVIFGPNGTEPLLGVTALESIGAVIDPGKQRLKMLPAISLK